MNSLKLKYSWLLGLVLAGLIGLTGCDNDDDGPATPTNTLKQVVDADAELTLFKAAIARGELETFLTGPGPFTLIAPTNAAFNAIGITTEADINAIDKNTLITLLTYHIIPSRRLIVEIPVGPNAPITTQGGLSLYASKTGGATYINGIVISTADVTASNGVVQKVGRVVSPPLLNVPGILGLNGTNSNYKLFLQAINKAGVSATFTASPVTAFVPTNAAMIAAGYDSTTIANTAAATLSPIVRYHAVAATRLYSSEFKTDSLKTALNTKFHLQKGAPSKVKGLTNAGYIDVTLTDITATNGVIHVINGVLKP